MPSHNTDAVKSRYRGEIVKAAELLPYLLVRVGSGQHVLPVTGGLDFEKEDGTVIHFDDIGYDEVDRRYAGKGVLWLDSEFGGIEAFSAEDHVVHPVVFVFLW